MRTALDHKGLVLLANDLIGVFRINPEHAWQFNPAIFRWGVERLAPGLTEHLVKKILPGKLGEIIGHTHMDTIYSSDWIRTPSLACSVSRDFSTLSEALSRCPGEPAQIFLALNARPVVYAAMYDILATQHFIGLRNVAWGQGLEPNTEYRPPSALERFVTKVRLSRTQRAA